MMSASASRCRSDARKIGGRFTPKWAGRLFFVGGQSVTPFTWSSGKFRYNLITIIPERGLVLMVGHENANRVMQVRNLQEFFRTSIDDVVAKKQVDIDPHAAHYVVNMLTLFSRSDELYEDDGEVYGLRPLALMLADAADAETVEQRNYLLQRIGDVALFVSGFFADGLAARAVDLDYYIHMGGNAYGSLSEEVRGTFRGNAIAGVYRELAAKFHVFVDVLNEIKDGSRDATDVDLLRTYEVWLRTGSRRAESILRQQGVVPFPDGRQRRH